MSHYSFELEDIHLYNGKATNLILKILNSGIFVYGMLFFLSLYKHNLLSNLFVSIIKKATNSNVKNDKITP